MPELKYLKTIGGFHGISAVFPKLQDVIDYEEGNIYINQGYPRFVSHPTVKILELKYKKKYKSFESISCHSFESAIFLVFDYFYQKGCKIFIDDKLTKILSIYFKEKFPDIIIEVDPNEAEVIFISNLEDFIENKIVIGIFNEKDLSELIDSITFSIIIINEITFDIGIILIFSSRYKILKTLRRHCGFNVSSRKFLKVYINKQKEAELEYKLKSTISKLEHLKSNHCYLYSSGMAAVFSSIFSLMSVERPKFILLGSLYVDTLRILEKWPKKFGLKKPIFIRTDIENNFQKYIDDEVTAVIIEVPSNPLIQLVDISKIVSIAHSHGSKVLVDNTIATPYNFNPFDYDVDVVVHSTTKFLSGKNNHIGGTVLTNNERIGDNIKRLNNLLQLKMHINDIKTLNRNIKSFEERMVKINRNAEIIANFLNNHESVEKVYYPSLRNNPNRELKEKYLRAGGGLLSFVLKDSSEENAMKFYDNILPPILKGPSLGSEKTLLSPYVMMAHYDDSEKELERLGFDFYLMRISVGVEKIDLIIKSLENGLNQLK
ncbi:MAG: PLP-dependent transferase [Promethearchaeota archaeon]